MEAVLYSCIGTTDPVRGMRDGGFMHILRFYRPEAVYLFLSREMVERDGADDRIAKTFAFLRENWAGYSPRLVRFETDIQDPSDMDALTAPMDALLQQVLEENPGTEILLNLSSGTPQMQILLAQMALDPRYPTRGIQVKNPEKQSGTAERSNTKTYPVDEALGLNEDEGPGAPNRCCEPRMMAVRREAVRNQLSGLISQRNYAAIAQMGAQLPAPIPKLAKHLDYRSRFLLKEARESAQGLTGLGLLAEPGELPYPVYEMVEYFGVLKHLVYLKRYTDFLLRLNPFLIRLQLQMLAGKLRPLGVPLEAVIATRDGHKVILPEGIRSTLPELLAFLESTFQCALQERDVSIRVLNRMLEHLGTEEIKLQLLSDCEKLNNLLRNQAAHSLFSVTNQSIRDICGWEAEQILRDLEKLLLETLNRFDPKELKKRLTVYERCDKKIRECL